MDIWFEGLSLPVSDLDRSIRFYEALGFATEVRTHQFGLMRYGTGTLGLLQLGARAMRDPREGAAVRRSFVQIEMGIARRRAAGRRHAGAADDRLARPALGPHGRAVGSDRGDRVLNDRSGRAPRRPRDRLRDPH